MDTESSRKSRDWNGNAHAGAVCGLRAMRSMLHDAASNGSTKPKTNAAVKWAFALPAHQCTGLAALGAVACQQLWSRGRILP